MKTSDILDETFLSEVYRVNMHGTTFNRPATVWDLEEALGLPNKLVRSKARSLIRRGRLEGCPCGCRGDFVVVLPRG